MSKQNYLLGTSYNSNIESIKDDGDRFVVKTLDRRFFTIDGRTKGFIDEIVAGGLNDPERKAILNQFVLKFLVPNGMYFEDGKERVAETSRKVPVLAHHYEVFNRYQIGKLLRPFSWLFNPLVAFLLVCSCLGIHLYYFIGNPQVISYDFVFTYSVNEIVIVFAISLLVSLFHELGHASACKHFSGDTGGIGVGLNIVVPVFYADVSDIHVLQKRQRVIVALSGTYFQLILTSLILAFFIDSQAIQKFIVINAISMVFNLLPLFRNDGYWCLNDIMGMKNLLQESVSVLLGKSVPKVSKAWVYAYLLFFTMASVLFSGIVLQFLFISGPKLYSSLLSMWEFNFANVLKFFFVTSYYLMVTMFVLSVSHHFLIKRKVSS